MVIANGADVAFLHHIIDDDFTGTIFKADKSEKLSYRRFYYGDNRIMEQSKSTELMNYTEKSKAEGLTEAEEKKGTNTARKEFVADVKKKPDSTVEQY